MVEEETVPVRRLKAGKLSAHLSNTTGCGVELPPTRATGSSGEALGESLKVLPSLVFPVFSKYFVVGIWCLVNKKRSITNSSVKWGSGGALIYKSVNRRKRRRKKSVLKNN